MSNDRVITLKHARQTPVTRYKGNSRPKQANRASILEFKQNESRAICESLIPQLRAIRYSAMAENLKWNSEADPLSNDCQLAIRASRLLVIAYDPQTNSRDKMNLLQSVQFLLKLQTGLLILDESTPDKPISHGAQNPHKFSESLIGWNEK